MLRQPCAPFVIVLFIGLSACSSGPGTPHAAQLESFSPDGELWGYRDASGEVVIEPQFSIANDFTPGGIATVADPQGLWVIDTTGKRLFQPFVFDNWADDFSEGLARFVAEDKIGYYDASGKVVIPARYDGARPFSEGLAAVCTQCSRTPDPLGGEHWQWTGGRWGYIDKTGFDVVALTLDSAESFKEGSAVVQSGNEYLRLDRRQLLGE